MFKRTSVVCFVLLGLLLSVFFVSVAAAISEEEWLAMSDGLKVTVGQDVVYNQDGHWRYRIKITSLKDGVVFREAKSIGYDHEDNLLGSERYSQSDLKDWFGSKLPLSENESVDFGSGFNVSERLAYEDWRIVGKTSSGEKVVGTVRVNFSTESAPESPTEEEWLAMSDGLKVTVGQDVVYNQDGHWRYRIKITSLKDGVTIENARSVLYDREGKLLAAERYLYCELQDWFGSKLPLSENESVDFGSGFNVSERISYEDWIVRGKTSSGEKVVGTVRVYFSNESAT